MFTVDELSTFLRDKAAERWAAEQQPYLLSSVGTDLKAKGQDYHSVLGDETLKAFVKRTGSTGGFKLVEHPIQRPKVGIVPVDEAFEFLEDDRTAIQGSGATERTEPTSRERLVLEFLRALGHLPDPLLDQVSIPTKVLARLLIRK